MNQTQRLVASSLLMLGFFGCGESASVEEAPIIDDHALDAVTTIDAALNPVTGNIASGLTTRGSLPTRDKFALGDLRTAAVRQPANGYVAFVQDFDRFGGVHGIRLARIGNRNRPGTLIYKGDRAIDSVAVNADGSLVTFSAQNEAGDFDVFLLDLEGTFLGSPGEVVALPSTSFDELDVSMSLDGSVIAWQGFDEATNTTNYSVALLDVETGDISVSATNISLGGLPIEQRQPSLTGSGNDVYFVSDDQVTIDAFGAPVVISFSTAGAGGAIAFAGIPGETTAITDPSASFDGEVLMVKETLGGVDSILAVDPLLGAVLPLLEDTTADHPYMTADGASFTFADNGTIFTADIAEFSPTAVPQLDLPALSSASPYWTRELPPEPPPPEGTIIYEGTTVGGPTFQRPEGSGPELLDGEVAFDATTITIEDPGFYDFLSVQDYDGYLHLYQGSFDPADPLGNLIIGNDDFGTFQSGFAVLMEPGEYVVVTSAFEAGVEGNFTNTITPRPTPEPGDAPVVEQFTESARVAEPNTTIDYSVFVSSADPITCSVDFGDGTVESVPCEPGTSLDFSHAFAEPGFYIVSFTATNVGGTATSEVFPTIAQDNPNQFNIVVVFGNNELSPAQRAAFETAADRWGEVIVGDLGNVVAGDPLLPEGFTCTGEPGFSGFVDDLVISAVGEPIDGPGSVLGSAGPCLIRGDGSNGDLFPLPIYGTMRFDVADLDSLEADGTLEAVILHEMGHVLGIGSLWEANGFLVGSEDQGGDPDSPDYDPRYIAPETNAAYTDLLNDAGLPLEDSVPIANTGGPGTRDSHWRELTFDTELMTGFLSPTTNPLSTLTVSTLFDLGYEVDLQSADPYTIPTPSVAGTRVAPIGHDEVITIKGLK